MQAVMYGLRLIKNCRIPDVNGREFYIDQDASYLYGKTAGDGPGYPIRPRPPRELLQRQAERDSRPKTTAGRDGVATAAAVGKKVQPAALERWQRCNSAPTSTPAHRPRHKVHDPWVSISLGEAPGGLGGASGTGVAVATRAAAVAESGNERYRTTASEYYVPEQMDPGRPVSRVSRHSEMSFRRLREPDESHVKRLHQGFLPGVTASTEIYAPEDHGPDIPMSKYHLHSEILARKAKPAEASQMRELPAGYLPYERPSETNKYKYFANKSIEMSAHFFPLNPDEGLGEARKRAGRGEVLDVVSPKSHL